MRYLHRTVVASVILLVASAAWAADTAELVCGRWSLADRTLQRDFPDMCLAGDTPWLAYIQYDGKADVLRLARKTEQGLENVAQIAGPGVLHQPAIARDGAGAIWCFWGQLGQQKIVSLYARRYAGGKLAEPFKLAESAASDTFADAGSDRAGRVWVVWQSMRRGQGDIFCRWLDPTSGRWSKELAITHGEGGNWEPRVAFDGRDGAWVAFDSSRGDEFNLYLAHVDLDGRTQLKQLTNSPEYEARASLAAAPDGKGLWIAGERGRQGWGKAARSHAGQLYGLNAQKRVVFGYYDIAAGTFREMPPATAVIARWAATGAPSGSGAAAGNPGARPKQPAGKAGKAGKRPRPAVGSPLQAVNLPVVAVDAEGNPWIACRFFTVDRWRIAAMKFDVRASAWSQPTWIIYSAFGQDHHAKFVRGAGGHLWLCWPADCRPDKTCGISGVYLAQLDAKAAPPLAGGPDKPAPRPVPEPYLTPPAPERPRSDRHTFTLDNKKYGLYWGDLHRHTDVSVCINQFDGCVLEQFRYAIDMANLDFLGTSDHTDHGKLYDPYEWWHNQRLVDVFYVPGAFNSLYAYEREQVWPWGHRNVIFAQRGGPIVYIQRKNYRNSPWYALYPVGEGKGPNPNQIMPEEMWQVLRKYGKPVTVISHTGATGMGTDWDLFRRVDNAVENLAEIYQGARVSYEGLGAPQPTAGLRRGDAYNTAAVARTVPPPQPIPDFGAYNHGVYQNALRLGHKLGVWADSDHISQHVSFGGVYAEEFTREGIIAALNARHTIAATDKIYLDFSCNGRMMGSIFQTGEKPRLEIAVNGTAPVKQVTIIRNETDYKVFPAGRRDVAAGFTDEAPVRGENRYYIRVEQTDGNMAWSSPVWVTFQK